MEPVILRTDSARYGPATVTAGQRGGADVLITGRQGPAVKRTIGTTGENARTKT